MFAIFVRCDRINQNIDSRFVQYFGFLIAFEQQPFDVRFGCNQSIHVTGEDDDLLIKFTGGELNIVRIKGAHTSSQCENVCERVTIRGSTRRSSLRCSLLDRFALLVQL